MKRTKTITMLLLISAIVILTFLSPFGSLAQGEQNISADALVLAGGEATFRILVKNDDNKPHKFLLSCANLQNDFSPIFLQDNKAATSIEIKAMDSSIIILKISIPQSTKAGSGSFAVVIKRDDGKSSTLPLSYTVNREYSLEITNRIDGLNVINGQSLSFDVAVSNTGSRQMDNVGLKLDLPYKWLVLSITPEKTTLKVNENRVFKVRISIPSSQVSGNSNVKASAIAGEVSSPQVSIPVTVQSNPVMIYWVVGLLIIVSTATILFFRKHGRR